MHKYIDKVEGTCWPHARTQLGDRSWNMRFIIMLLELISKQRLGDRICLSLST